MNHKFDRKIQASYWRTGDSVRELQDELIREALKLKGIGGSAIRISSISDIPPQGSAPASSITRIVGLLNTLYAHTDHLADAERLSREICQTKKEQSHNAQTDD